MPTTSARVVTGDPTTAAEAGLDQGLTMTPQQRLRVDAGGGGSVTDSTGASFDPDSLTQNLTYNGDGTVNTIAATDGTNTWTQTFTYTSGNLTGISKWVKA